MTLFSQILKDEHTTLLKLFDELQTMDKTNPLCREHFSLTKFMLFEHLKKEDSYLYPAIQGFEKKGLLKTNRFSSEIIQLSEFATDFFSKYDNGLFTMDFFANFGQFLAVLKKRIIREESTLFPIYDDLSRQDTNAHQ